MAVIAMCVVLVVIGAAMVVRWGGVSYGEARPDDSYWLHFFTALAAGLAAGAFAAGPGSRLVMRLLAVTSPEAKGRITDAEAIVGRITLIDERAGGTLAFILFIGPGAGLVSGALYALVRPLLPPRRADGVLLGVLLLVLAGTRIEPLRASNPDFQIVGPGWLAVLGFTALALFQGMLVVALGRRLSHTRLLRPGLADTYRPELVLRGRIALGVLVLVALPSFVDSVDTILG
jgi:hypothetical protein